jgi:hypothetical protein
MSDQQANRDQRRAAFREGAEIAHDLFLEFIAAGFTDPAALELTMQILDLGFDDALHRREM